MVPPTALGTTGNLNVLPDDIFNYNQEKFYEFIKEKYGDDLSQLLSFQAIRNGTHLLDTTSEDILLILEEESEDINKLKQLCCFIASNNKYFVKLGVKLVIKNLIQSLKMK